MPGINWSNTWVIAGEYAIFVGGLTVPLHNFWADTGIAYAKEKYPNLKSGYRTYSLW